MTITQIYPFTTSGNYEFDAAKIEVVSSTAQLLISNTSGQLFTQTFSDDSSFVYDSTGLEFVNGRLQQKLNVNSNQTFTQAFTNSDGFSFDSLKTEISGGTVRQIDQRPSDVLDFFPFTIDEDPVWGSTTNGTLSGGAIVSGGLLDLTSADGKEFTYSGFNNYRQFGNDGQEGTFRFDILPNWPTGNPPDIQAIIEAGGSGNKNALFMSITTGGTITIDIRDDAGSANAFSTGAQTWVNSQRYTIELNYDTTGTTRLFKDGIQIGAWGTSGITTSNSYKGTVYHSRGGTDNFFLDNILWFSSVQHTGSHTLESVPDETIYVGDRIELPVFSYTNVGSILNFTDLTTIESFNPRYTINNLYWSGSEWATSADSYSEASQISDINSNIPTLPASDSVAISAFFTEVDTQMSIDNLILTYDGQQYLTTSATLPIFAYPGADDLTAFVSFTTSESGVPRYIINSQYWTGSQWANSNLSYTQANNASDIDTNIESLTATDTVTIMTMYAGSVSDQSYVENLEVGYNGKIYPVTNDDIKPIALLNADNITTFSADVTEPGSSSVTFTIEVDGTEQYWTGSQWAASTGYPDTNDATTINSNATSLLSAGAEIRPVVYLHSDSGAVTSVVDEITIVYDVFCPVGDEPLICTVCGRLRNSLNEVVANATVQAEVSNADVLAEKNFFITNKAVQTTTDSNGYFEIELVRSSEYEASYTYNFIFTLDSNTAHVVRDKTIPDSDSIEFKDL